MCVLLVEDNEQVGEFATEALRKLGFDSVHAVDAECALNELEKDSGRFHIVFSDVVMPGMSGLELMDRASANPGAALRRLLPRPSDYFVVKPQFSGFYATNLPVLLPKLGISRLIVTGISTDICVLFTAADAHMRDYRLWVPEDAVATIDPHRSRTALHLMRDALGAETGATTAIDLARWSDERDESGRQA